MARGACRGVELDDHGVVGVVELDQAVALIGERAARLLEVRADGLLAVIYIAGRDDLVARVLEGGEGDIELVPVLGLHVLADGPLASLAQLLGDGHSRSHWRSLASMSA